MANAEVRFGAAAVVALLPKPKFNVGAAEVGSVGAAVEAGVVNPKENPAFRE